MTDYPLLTWLDGLLGQLDPLDELRERFTYVPADDPEGAPGGLVPGGTYGSGTYGAGVYGPGSFGGLGTADLVDPGTADAAWLPWLAQLVGASLAGLTVVQQRAAILAASTEAWGHGTAAAIIAAAQAGLTGTQDVELTPHYGGDPFVIGLGTLTAETDSPETYGELKAVAPTWAHLEALGSFANAGAPTVVHAAEVERPAGYRLEHYLSDAP